MYLSLKGIIRKRLITLYEAVLTPRIIEEKMLKLLRQGKISESFIGTGKEAISAGATLALQREGNFLPLSRFRDKLLQLIEN